MASHSQRCLTLLLMRLAVPAALPLPRRAFTPPFHPYPFSGASLLCGRYIFCCAVCQKAEYLQENPPITAFCPGVTRHHTLRSPDFPPKPETKFHSRAAVWFIVIYTLPYRYDTFRGKSQPRYPRQSRDLVLRTVQRRWSLYLSTSGATEYFGGTSISICA